MNDIAELREHLFETLRGLRNKDDPMDIDRAKAVSDVAKTVIDSARVEVDYMRTTGETRGTGFITLDGHETKRQGLQILQNDKNGKTTVEERDGMRVTRHIAK